LARVRAMGPRPPRSPRWPSSQGVAAAFGDDAFARGCATRIYYVRSNDVFLLTVAFRPSPPLSPCHLLQRFASVLGVASPVSTASTSTPAPDADLVLHTCAAVMPLCPEGDALPARLSLQLWPARSPSPRSGTYASGPWAFALGSTGLRTLRAGVASVATTLANALAATSARCPPTALLEWARRISGSPPALGLVPSVRLAALRRYASVQGHRVSGSLGCRPRSGAPPETRVALLTTLLRARAGQWFASV